MNRFLLGLLSVCLAVALFTDADAGRRHRRSNNCQCEPSCECQDSCRCENVSHFSYANYRKPKAVKGDLWPDEPTPEPVPEPEPTPDEPSPTPDPLPEPLPEPTPDPEPLPPEPEPTPPTPSIPADPAELNTYVAQHLGGYVRANHDRNGVAIPIYQARGKQRICWTVAEADDWPMAFVRAFQLKARAGSSNAGIVLVCNSEHPAPEPDPVPEPLPEPQPEPTPEPAPPEPLPAPDADPLPPGPIDPVLKRHGGPSLDEAQEACQASGLWLVVVHRYGGEVNRVIYAPPR